MTTFPARRLAVVVSHPVQYYSPWFRWMTSNGWPLRVFYLWDFGIASRHDPEFGRPILWDVDLLSGYDWELVPNIAREPGTHHFGGLNNPSLGQRLQAWGPGVILIFGYNYLTHLCLILGSDRPLIFRGDSHLLDQPKPPLFKTWLLTELYSRFAAVTYVGQANRDYFRAYGVPSARLFPVPHCVDAERFTPSPALLAEAAALRRSLGLEDRRIVLFAGKFIAKKQPLALLEAFLSVARADSALVFVGDGEQLPVMQALASSRPESAVRFLPFANQTEMPARYLMADVLVLPSQGPGETWGLAVNEAMHLGLPCLVSDRVGCQRDLVTDGQTGWVFTAGSTEGLRFALARALTADLASMKAAIAERIAGYAYPQATRGLARAIEAAASPRIL
jgi:glycosyltransferase involved in cell wall biosynthesis